MNNYKKINNLIRAKKYTEALSVFLSLNKEDVLLLDEKISFDSFLFVYFSKEKKYSRELEEELATKFPDNFVKAIRTSQVFIDKNRLYLNDFSLTNDLNIHQKVWINLQQTEKQLWEDIQKELYNVLELEISEVLSEVIFWLETERYHSDSKQKQYELATTYSFFITLYLHNSKQTINASFNNDEVSDFDRVFLEKVGQKIKNKTNVNPTVSKLLNLIEQWNKFNSNILQAYCFDLNIEPNLENGVIHFNQKPNNYYKWHLDGIRYEKNRVNYQQKASKVVFEEVSSQKLIIPGNTEEDFSNNMLGAIRLRKMKLFLEDLNIYESSYKGIENGLYKIFSSILGFSFNRFYRYEENLDKFKISSKNWYDAYIKIVQLSMQKMTVISAYLLMNNNQYISRNENTFSNIPKSVFREGFKILSHTVNKKFEFNRFNINYDVWHKPFIKVGNVFFSPMLFFSNNDWFFSSSQLAINITNKNHSIRKKTATEMEKYLADKFSKKGFEVKVINDKQANNIEGDVDLIVEDNDTTLFIQLKRTYFRLNPKDAYYESVTSDKKASKQLNGSVKSLIKENEFYNIHKEPVKWIVSTSFESINSNINNCNKINYFELLFALENNNIKSLQELVNNFEKDYNMLHFYNVKDDDFKKQTQLMNIVGLPLELVEPRKYLNPIFIDKGYNENYNTIFSKAIELYGKNDKKAIKLLKKCLLINENDIDIYGALGNCYANLKDLPNLTKSFEKALDIIPNEPYIKRNYALALIENEKYFEGILMLQELNNDYKLIGDFAIIFMANYSRYRFFFTKEQDEILNSNWNI